MGKVLADTSAWIDFLTRPATASSKVLRGLLDQDAVCITGLILAELLHGSQTDQQAVLLLTRLSPLEFLETTREAWIMAGRTAAALRRQGINLPLNDCVLAAVAHTNNCSIYTTDAHFSRIPHVKLFRP